MHISLFLPARIKKNLLKPRKLSIFIKSLSKQMMVKICKRYLNTFNSIIKIIKIDFSRI